MACTIKRSSLSPEIAHQIRSMLSFIPETNPFQNQFQQKFWNSSSNDSNEPILFYSVEKDVVHLPYLFAGSLFKIFPNSDVVFPTTNLSFSGNLREHQIKVETEAWEQLQQRGTTTLGLYPGFGKTILGAKLASRAKLLTVVYVHRELLTTQWKKTFTDFTNASVWIVGEKNPPPICDIIICMDTRWHHIPQELRDKVGFLIIDEAHCFCTRSHIPALLAFHPRYVVAESGSLLREDGLHSIMYAIVGSHGIFRETNKPFNVVKVMTNTKPLRKLNRMKGVDYTALTHDTLMDPRRNRIILDFIQMYKHKKILVLTSLVDHANLLNEETRKLGITSDSLCGTKKNYDDANVLIGTTSKLGTGFDQSSFCETFDGRHFDLLLLVTSMKKYSMLTQNVGRAFRSECPTVLHFVDNDDIFKRHWYKAKKWYITHGATVSEWNIPNMNDPTIDQISITEQQISWTQQKLSQLNQQKKLTLNIKN